MYFYTNLSFINNFLKTQTITTPPQKKTPNKNKTSILDGRFNRFKFLFFYFFVHFKLDFFLHPDIYHVHLSVLFISREQGEKKEKGFAFSNSIFELVFD